MNTPSLPPFSAASVHQRRTHRHRLRSQQQQRLRRQQQLSDAGLFLFTCGLIAYLVHLAFS